MKHTSHSPYRANNDLERYMMMGDDDHSHATRKKGQNPDAILRQTFANGGAVECHNFGETVGRLAGQFGRSKFGQDFIKGAKEGYGSHAEEHPMDASSALHQEEAPDPSIASQKYDNARKGGRISRHDIGGFISDVLASPFRLLSNGFNAAIHPHDYAANQQAAQDALQQQKELQEAYNQMQTAKQHRRGGRAIGGGIPLPHDAGGSAEKRSIGGSLNSNGSLMGSDPRTWSPNSLSNHKRGGRAMGGDVPLPHDEGGSAETSSYAKRAAGGVAKVRRGQYY